MFPLPLLSFLFTAESSTVHYDMYFTEYEISLMPDGDRQVLYQEPSDSWSPGAHRSHQFSTQSPGDARGSRGQLGEERAGHTSLEAGEGKRRRDQLEKQRHHGLLSSGSSYKGHLGQFSSSPDTVTHSLFTCRSCLRPGLRNPSDSAGQFALLM